MKPEHHWRIGRCTWPTWALASFLFFLFSFCHFALLPARAAFRQDYPTVHYPDRLNVMIWKDAQGVSHPVRTVDDWERRRRHVVQNFEAVAGTRPASLSDPDQVEYHTIEKAKLAGCLRRKIVFSVDGDDKIHAYLFIPDKASDGKRPAMLCLHQTTKFGKAEPAGVAGQSQLHIALELAQRGYVALAPDYPRFGDSTTDPYKMGYVSATAKGIVNHRRCVTLLTQLPEVDPERIGCMGHSLGGHNSIFVALHDSRIKAIASSCGFCSFPKYYEGNLKGWTHAGYMPRIASAYQSDPKQVPFDFTELLAALAPRPVFINAPLHDANFDVEGVRDCLRAAEPVYRLHGKAGHLVAEHPDCAHAFPEEIREKCYRFLDGHLRR